MESLGRLPRRLRLAEALPGCLGRPEYSSEEECSSVEELGYRSRSRTAEEERNIGEYSAHPIYCLVIGNIVKSSMSISIERQNLSSTSRGAYSILQDSFFGVQALARI